MWARVTWQPAGFTQDLHGLQGFLPHLSGHIGGDQHAAELALATTALNTQISLERPSRKPATKPVAAP